MDDSPPPNVPGEDAQAPDKDEEVILEAVPPLVPVQASERFAELDVLRGVAVLGIFLVNVAYMAFPMDWVEPWHWDDLSWPDRLVRAGVEFFAEYKFITLFSLLFGMGLALQQRRAEQAGRTFAGMYSRRLGILLLIGILHGTLLWFGDILTAYALLGFVALACRGWSTRRLAVLAAVLFVVPLAFVGLIAVVSPDTLTDPHFDWHAQAEELRREADEEAGGDAGTRATLRFFEFMGREEEIYRYGSFGEMVAHRSVYFFFAMVSTLTTFSWRILAMFLLGICLLRVGMFINPAWPVERYKRMVVLGLFVGVPLQLAVLALRIEWPDDALGVYLRFAALYVASLAMAAAYAGAVGWWCRSELAPALRRRLAAVGRMALTNYLMHSAIAVLVFYSYGLGWFGLMTHWQTMLLVLAVFVFQLAFSPWWLARHRFGPVEALWRWGTYGRTSETSAAIERG